MRLATYQSGAADTPRIGCVLALASGDALVDLRRCCRDYLESVEKHPDARRVARMAVPKDMSALLAHDPELHHLRAAVAFASAELQKDGAEEKWRSAGRLFGLDEIRLLPPVPRPGKILMTGGNYKAHVGETRKAGSQLPSGHAEKATTPNAFAKFASVQIGHMAPVVYPRHTAQLDYEVELCVVIGRRCKDVAPGDVPGVIAGYTIVNDVSMREIQFAEMRRGAAMFGKNLDTALPAGPYLVTRDAIPDPQNLRIQCRVNGQMRQDDTTANMIFSIADIVSFYSRLTLEPGDMISTGSPAGVGIFWDPPEQGLLKVGDLIEMEIEGLGVLQNRVVAEPRGENAV